MKKSPTQREEIARLTGKLEWGSAYTRAAKELREVLDRSQNPVEHGGQADGSVSEDVWVAARDVATALEAMGAAVEKLDLATRKSGHQPRLLAEQLVAVQPMTAPVPPGLFEFHFKSPEDERNEFRSAAWAPGTTPVGWWDWDKGHVTAFLHEGQWKLSWWKDAEPLTSCLPSIEARPNVWLENRMGLYPDPPTGTVMVTLGTAAGGSTMATVICIPAEKEAEMRAKLTFPPLPPAGPEYGG